MSLEELEEEHRQKEDVVIQEKPRTIKVGEQVLGKLGPEMMKQVDKSKRPEDVAAAVADTIVDSYGTVDSEEEENEKTKAAELEALAKQVLEEQHQLAILQDSILKQQYSILQAFGAAEGANGA